MLKSARLPLSSCPPFPPWHPHIPLTPTPRVDWPYLTSAESTNFYFLSFLSHNFYLVFQNPNFNLSFSQFPSFLLPFLYFLYPIFISSSPSFLFSFPNFHLFFADFLYFLLSFCSPLLPYVMKIKTIEKIIRTHDKNSTKQAEQELKTKIKTNTKTKQKITRFKNTKQTQ